jgi:membrane dipeptidase
MEKIKDLFVIDSHCDSIQPVSHHELPLVNPYNYSSTYPQLQFVAAFCGWPGEDAEKSYARAMRYIGCFYTQMQLYSDRLVQVRTYADIEKAFAEGKHAALLTVEGATGYMGDVTVLREFYAAGVRVTGLCWLSNDLAKSNRVYSDGEEDTGLTDTGREIVAEANRLGMIFDCSHMSDRSFWDVNELSVKPMVATHSNFRAVASHSRNLTDDMAREIARRGGMIGLNLCKAFISDDPEKQDCDGYFAHLDYALGLIGEDCVGFGGDIDGVSNRYPAPLTRERSIHDTLIEIMLKHNYSEDLIRKVAGGNWMNFLRKYL